jgi:hypothetical protein
MSEDASEQPMDSMGEEEVAVLEAEALVVEAEALTSCWEVRATTQPTTPSATLRPPTPSVLAPPRRQCRHSSRRDTLSFGWDTNFRACIARWIRFMFSASEATVTATLRLIVEQRRKTSQRKEGAAQSGTPFRVVVAT